MTFLSFCRVLVAGLAVSSALLTAATPGSREPVTPGATPEARALLELLYDLSGKHTLTGQHNYPNIKDRNTRFAARYTGAMPAVFSTDFGHAKPGDTDSYLARPDIVQESIRQHRLGAIVTICWHAVPPTADEPITFAPLPGADPKALRSVQGKLLDAQFRDVLTPGTALHAKWAAQVDAIAVPLKELQLAKVPVLWRPYHEMNGDWFWWGGRGADTAALYKQIHDRLVNHHGLKNLVWVWSVDRVSRPGMEHEKYWPGLEFVDVLGLDVYGNDFAQKYYDSLEKLSQGKPLALAEVGNPPALEILERQPKWTFFVVWAGMTRNAPRPTYDTLFASPRVVNLDDAEYGPLTKKYRQDLGLPPVALASKSNFTGEWLIDDSASQFTRGAASSPARLEVNQLGDDLRVRSTTIVEFAEDRSHDDHFTIDGPAAEAKVNNSTRSTRVQRGAKASLVFETTTAAPGAPGGKSITKATWSLLDDGRTLMIESNEGARTAKLVFRRR